MLGRWIAACGLLGSVIMVSAPVAADSSPVATSAENPPGFSAISPERVVDTRKSERVPAQGTIKVGLPDSVVVADRAIAAAMTVTVVNPSDWGFVTVFPCGSSLPDASNVNYTAGVTRAATVFSKLGDSDEICLYSYADTDVLVDITGVFYDTASLSSIAPRRLADTRKTGTLEAESVITVPIAGAADSGVPADASHAVVTLTAVDAQGWGFLTAYACGSNMPDASNLNYDAGDTLANQAVVPLNDNGELCVYSYAASDVLVDVVGYFSGMDAIDEPTRIADSRKPGEYSSRLIKPGSWNGEALPADNGTYRVLMIDASQVGKRVTSMYTNITVVPSNGAEGHVSPVTCGVTADNQVGISVANYAGAVTANSAVLDVNRAGYACLLVYDYGGNAGNVDLIVDVIGWTPAGWDSDGDGIEDTDEPAGCELTADCDGDGTPDNLEAPDCTADRSCEEHAGDSIDTGSDSDDDSDSSDPVDAVDAPNNDAWANRTVLTGTSGSVEHSTVGATSEANEPGHPNGPFASVWYSFTPDRNGVLTIDTNGSNYDTMLGVHTGTSLSAARTVASNDDNGERETSKVVTSVTEGVEYHIAVDGWRGATGDMDLSWSLAAAIDTPLDGTTIYSHHTRQASYNHSDEGERLDQLCERCAGWDSYEVFTIDTAPTEDVVITVEVDADNDMLADATVSAQSGIREGQAFISKDSLYVSGRISGLVETAGDVTVTWETDSDDPVFDDLSGEFTFTVAPRMFEIDGWQMHLNGDHPAREGADAFDLPIYVDVDALPTDHDAQVTVTTDATCDGEPLDITLTNGLLPAYPDERYTDVESHYDGSALPTLKKIVLGQLEWADNVCDDFHQSNFYDKRGVNSLSLILVSENPSINGQEIAPRHNLLPIEVVGRWQEEYGQTDDGWALTGEWSFDSLENFEWPRFKGLDSSWTTNVSFFTELTGDETVTVDVSLALSTNYRGEEAGNLDNVEIEPSTITFNADNWREGVPVTARFTTTEGPLEETPSGDLIFELVGTSPGSSNAAYIGHYSELGFGYSGAAENSVSVTVIGDSHLYVGATHSDGLEFPITFGACDPYLALSLEECREQILSDGVELEAGFTEGVVEFEVDSIRSGTGEQYGLTAIGPDGVPGYIWSELGSWVDLLEGNIVDGTTLSFEMPDGGALDAPITIEPVVYEGEPEWSIELPAGFTSGEYTVSDLNVGPYGAYLLAKSSDGTFLRYLMARSPYGGCGLSVTNSSTVVGTEVGTLC